MSLTIISLLEDVIYVDLENFEDYKIFAGIFASDENNVINRIQIADTSFKSRIENSVDVTIEGLILSGTKSELREIPINSKFIVLRGYYDEDFFLSSLKCEVYKLNNLNSYISDLSQNKDIHSLYKTFMFYGGGDKEYIGNKNVNERVCRFCGGRVPDVSFTSKKAHALSEFLGNKSLVCLEECAKCNSYFGETIERELSKMLSPVLSLFMIKGKKGYRKVRGKNFVLTPRKREDGNGFYIRLESRENTPVTEVDGYKFFDASSIKYVPQDVYKCLCKYVISVIDCKYLPNFQKTIEWIKCPTKYRKLPLVAINKCNGICMVPSMTINIRKDDNYNIPYCIATLNASDSAFVFILPFCTKDRFSFTSPLKYMNFKEIVRSEFSFKNWTFEDFSYSKRRSTPYNIYMKMFDDKLHC